MKWLFVMLLRVCAHGEGARGTRPSRGENGDPPISKGAGEPLALVAYVSNSPKAKLKEALAALNNSDPNTPLLW